MEAQNGSDVDPARVQYPGRHEIARLWSGLRLLTAVTMLLTVLVLCLIVYAVHSHLDRNAIKARLDLATTFSPGMTERDLHLTVGEPSWVCDYDGSSQHADMIGRDAVPPGGKLLYYDRGWHGTYVIVDGEGRVTRVVNY